MAAGTLATFYIARAVLGDPAQANTLAFTALVVMQWASAFSARGTYESAWKRLKVIADEPTGNLDGKAGREVLTLLRQVNRELGITLVLVTHDLNVAEQADRVIQLEDGRVAHDSEVVPS